MTALTRQPAWWIVVWGLITGLTLNCVLPALDHHAAEYSPFHEHLILGAASPAEREALLAGHQHGAGQPHQHDQTTQGTAAAAPQQAEPSVTVLGTGVIDSLLSLAAGAGDRLAQGDALPVLPPLALWLTLIPIALLFSKRAAPPLEQPPRLSW
jgi:hypothetical protein